LDAVEAGALGGNPPRGRVLRAAITAVLWLVVFVGPVVLNEEVVVPLLQALNGDAWGADLAIGAVWLVAQFAVFAWLCPKASYRWFDCLVMVVPIAGLAIWAPRILWRVAYLPYRDWRPRPGEADVGQRIAEV
jgi:hypothetical protein